MGKRNNQELLHVRQRALRSGGSRQRNWLSQEKGGKAEISLRGEHKKEMKKGEKKRAVP